MVPLSRESGIPEATDTTRIHLPIEGYTAWPQLLRLVAAGSGLTILMLSFILSRAFTSAETKIDPQMLLLGLVCAVIFEIVIVRRLIIPMNGDYGRYRINEGRVDLYPLSAFGMKVLTRPESIPMQDFSGVTVQTMAVKGSQTKYTVTLMHPQRANMVRVRPFSSRVEAENYARALADALSLDVIATSH